MGSGRVKVVCGDSRGIDSVWVQMAGSRKPTAIVTSPPYAHLKDYGSSKQIGYGQTYAAYLDDMDDVFRGLAKISSPATSMWLVVDTFREVDRSSGVWTLRHLPADLSQVAKEHGWIARDVIIWEKDRTLPWSTAGRLRNSFEYVLLFVRSASFAYHIDRIREPIRQDGWWHRWPERHNPGGSVPTNVWRIPIPIQGSWRRDASHACPLPPELVRRLVDLSTEPGDAVLDPFAGTGVVPTMAADMGRDAFGVDLSRESVEQFQANRLTVLAAVARGNDDGSVAPEDVIQARRLKLAGKTFAMLRDAGVGPLLADVRDSRSQTELRADMDLALIYETGSPRPDAAQVAKCWEKAPLSKFGLDVRFRILATSTWMRQQGGRTLYEPAGRGFYKMRLTTDLSETRRRAISRKSPFVVCSDPPQAYVF